MVNIKPTIEKAFKEVFDNVYESSVPQLNAFPTVRYLEEDNKVYLKTEDEEQQAYVKYQIDIWDDKDTSIFALKVDEVLGSLGFNRIQSTDISETSQIKHKVMKYDGIIDIKTMNIYELIRGK